MAHEGSTAGVAGEDRRSCFSWLGLSLWSLLNRPAAVGLNNFVNLLLLHGYNLFFIASLAPRPPVRPPSLSHIVLAEAVMQNEGVANQTSRPPTCPGSGFVL